ncbi:MAG: LemA family protein [Phycisphaerales bacterium]
MSTPMLLAIVVGALALVWAVVTFNRLVGLRARAENAWSDIDVQLKKRWDLVPRLAEVVRAYAAHESKTMEDVTRARAEAGAGPAKRAPAESAVGRDAVRLLAVAEAYPDLRADELFRSLHDQLVDVEEDLQAARRYYNAVVRDLNILRATFPSVLVAGAMGLRAREYFELEDPREGDAPSVGEALS